MNKETRDKLLHTLRLSVSAKAREKGAKYEELWADTINTLCNNLSITDINTLTGLEFKEMDEKNAGWHQSGLRDSLMVTNNKGYWIFNWFSQSEKGSLIKLLNIAFGWDFETSLAHIYAVSEDITIEKPAIVIADNTAPGQSSIKKTSGNTKNTMSYKDLSFTTEVKTTYAYLCTTRKISTDLVHYLQKQGLIKTVNVKDKIFNTCFIFKDFSGLVVGAAQSGNYVANGKERYKGILGESANEYGFNVNLSEKVETVAFFEGAEDLLAFISLYPYKLKTTHFVAMLGLKDECIACYKNHYKDNVRYVACTDNDHAGIAFAKKTGLKHVPVKDNLKDWGDVAIANEAKIKANSSVLKDIIKNASIDDKAINSKIPDGLIKNEKFERYVNRRMCEEGACYNKNDLIEASKTLDGSIQITKWLNENNLNKK